MSQHEVEPKQIDNEVLKRQLALLEGKEETFKEMQVCRNIYISGDANAQALGDSLIDDGRVAALIIAGGDGSRLQFSGPKGAFPLTFDGKTLFEILCQKIVQRSLLAKNELVVAVMTSPKNHNATVEFFHKNKFFNLNESQIDFFQQSNLPFLTAEGKFVLDNDQIVFGPAGNGLVFHHLKSAGLLNKWKRGGVKYINLIPVDNPLADPFDPELVGLMETKRLDALIKCITRENIDESVGVVAEVEGKTLVVEYFEIPENERRAKNDDGTFKFLLANSGMLGFNMNFAVQVANKPIAEMPLHKTLKKISSLKDAPAAWKFERFIFDTLKWTNHCAALLCDRKKVFAPLKNREGLNEVIAALQQGY